MQGLDEAAKLHFRESKLPIILAVITSLRCQQFSNISPAPTTKQDKYFHKRGSRESASAGKVGKGGGGVGERRGFSFPIPAPSEEHGKMIVCDKRERAKEGEVKSLA